MDDLHNMSGRLNGVITFTIIPFVYSILVLHLSSIEIVLFASIGILSLLVVRSHSVALNSIVSLVQKMSVMVASQVALRVLGVDTNLGYSASTPVSTVLQTLTVVTCILVLASFVPQYFHDLDLVQRCVTLVLFTFAEAIESLFSVRRMGTTPSLVCVLVYMCLYKYESMLGKVFTLQYLIRAINMVTINFILRALVDSNQDVVSIHIQT